MLTLVLAAASCGSDSDNDPGGGSDDGSGASGSDGSGGADADGGSPGAAGASGGSDGDGSGAAATGTGDGSGGASTNGGGSDTGGEGGAEPILLEIEVAPDLDRHAISPFIYGAMTEEAILSMDATLARLSGNELTAYNWEINATNLGLPGEHLNAPLGAEGDAGSAALARLQLAAANGGMAYLTVPVSDYVAADAEETSVLESEDTLNERFVRNQAVKGAAFEYPPDTTDGVVYQDEFVNWVMSEAADTPVVFGLGNQPSLWDQDHPLIHPVKATYEDVVNIDVEFAKAIKDVWSDALVAGPVLYGWQAFVNLQNSPDFDSEGDFLDYYLGAMQAASDADGRRLLDTLDVRWWTQAEANGVRVNSDDNSPEVVFARMQAPRSLWDENYVEDSWIPGSNGGEPIALISRLRDKIAAHYPDTELGISAWMFGGGEHISGAIAAADALGIFGREGVQYSAVELAPESPYVMAAFEAFLNFDGEGGRFLDTSVRATTSDRAGSSVYASSDSEEPADLVIVAINKRELERELTLSIDSDVEYQTSQVYELTEQDTSLAPAPSLTADENVFSYDMPPTSVVVLVPET